MHQGGEGRRERDEGCYSPGTSILPLVQPPPSKDADVDADGDAGCWRRASSGLALRLLSLQSEGISRALSLHQHPGNWVTDTIWVNPWRNKGSASSPGRGKGWGYGGGVEGKGGGEGVAREGCSSWVGGDKLGCFCIREVLWEVVFHWCDCVCLVVQGRFYAYKM